MAWLPDGEMCYRASSQGPPSPNHILLLAAPAGPFGLSSAGLVLAGPL